MMRMPMKQYEQKIINICHQETGEKLNLENPKTFNEKMQWLRLYDSTPIKSRLADKYLVRDWIQEKIGDEYLVPLLGVYTSFDEIDFTKLPERFVIKCNHGRSWSIVVKNKNELDLKETKEKIDRWMSMIYGEDKCEFYYRMIHPRILIEEYIEQPDGNLLGWTFFCFNGKAHYLRVDMNELADHTQCFFDMDFNKLKLFIKKTSCEKNIEKPKNFLKMKKIAEMLSHDFSYACIGFYNVDGNIKFAKITFSPTDCFEKNFSEVWNKKNGDLISLPDRKYDVDLGIYFNKTVEKGKQETPIFSIVVPVYNAEKYLDECLSSIINQTFKDFEVICMDDGSTDASLKILRKYEEKDSRVHVFHQENKGEAAARNFCLEKAVGKYITALDADDVMCENNLAEKYKVMEYEGAEICFCSSIDMTENGDLFKERRRGWRWMYQLTNSPMTFREFFPSIFSCFNGQSASVYLRSFICENKLQFPVNVGFEDKVFLFQAVPLAKKISILKKDLIRVRLSIGSEQRGGSEYLFDMVKAWDIIIDSFKKYGLFEEVKTQIFLKLYENFLWCYGRLQKRLLSQFRELISSFFIKHKIRPVIDFDLQGTRLKNAQAFFLGKQSVFLSLILLVKKNTFKLQSYINNFSGNSDMLSELIIVDLSGKIKDEDLILAPLNRISILHCPFSKKKAISLATDQALGQYILLQTDNDILNKPVGLHFCHQFSKSIYNAIVIPTSSPILFNQDIETIIDAPFIKKQDSFDIANLTADALHLIKSNQISLIYARNLFLYLLDKGILFSNFLEQLSFAKNVYFETRGILSRYNPLKKRYFSCLVQQLKQFICLQFHKLKYVLSLPKSLEVKQSVEMSSVDVENSIKKMEDDIKKNVVKIDSQVKQNLTDDYKRELLLNSPLWDERYYLSQFNFKYSSLHISPLDHYLNVGWKEGLNPSAYFDGNSYLKKYTKIQENPLFHFLNRGRFEYNFGFSRNVYPIDEAEICSYWKNKSRTKKVVYMCITGDYDDLYEIKAHTYINKDWDYVCFTDNKNWITEKKIGIWQIKKLKYTKLDNSRNNRWHKFFPHKILKKYDESIYIDSNVNILTPFLFQEIERRGESLLLPNHATTFSVYEEMLWGIKDKIDNPELIIKEYNEIFKTGHPFNYGKPECNIIYRKHNDPLIRKIMDEWWMWLVMYAKRDQFSFAYLLWKYKIDINNILFVNSRVDYKDFCVFLHPVKR